ncbi:hypothetical protein BH23GEM6_BH23GEM6_18510 [soil metagenome]
MKHPHGSTTSSARASLIRHWQGTSRRVPPPTHFTDSEGSIRGLGLVCLVLLALLLVALLAPASVFSQAAEQRDAQLNEGYRLIQRGDTLAARAAFRRSIDLDPAAVQPRLELAYALLRADSSAAAAEQLERVLELQPGQLELHRQLAYIYTAHQPARAREHLERAAQLDPSDQQLRLELAYLHARLGDRERSRAALNQVAGGPVGAPRTQALAELAAMRGSAPRGGSWLTELFLMPLLYTEASNLVGHLQLRTGPVIESAQQAQVYASLRATRDSRSFNRQLPEVFSDNVLIPALGFRFRPESGPVVVYAEAGPAFPLATRPGGSSDVRPDIRAGTYGHTAWGTGALRSGAPWLTGEAYGDVSYYSRFDQNVIGYLQLRPGLGLARLGSTDLSAFALGSTVLDTNREAYNNLGELGGGLVLHHRGATQAMLRAEYLGGRYLLDRAETPRGYRDLRVTLMVGRTLISSPNQPNR